MADLPPRQAAMNTNRNPVARMKRQEAATDGCAGISGAGKHRPLATARAPRGRHRAGAFHYWRREIPGTLLPILFDEFYARSRIDPRLARAVDVAASHGRPVGNHHPALAGIGGAHASAPSRILSSHCFLRHETLVRGLARSRKIKKAAAVESSADLSDRRWLPVPCVDLLRDLAGAHVRV